MIHFLLTRAHGYTIQQYLETWGRDLRDCIAPPVFYEDLRFGPALAPGTYIFSDLERLNEAQLELARVVWNQLSTRPDAFALLNDPSRALRRFDLLQTLHEQGINRFKACRIGRVEDLKYPAFLRRASEHDGAISALLENRAALDSAVADAIAKGAIESDLLAVEYFDTADAAGLFRKFSAFRVGDQILARHVFHRRQWMIKHDGIVDEAFVAEELALLRTNPHEPQLRRIFDIARIDYGRIDYALASDGQVQVWEINTNPTIIVPPGRVAPPRLLAQALFAESFATAIRRLDHAAAVAAPMRLQVPGELAKKLGAGAPHRLRRLISRALTRIARRLDA